MKIGELLKSIAFVHASFMLGLCAIVLYYYFVRIRTIGLMQWHVLSVVIAHIGLTICTMITISKDIYLSDDPWFYVAGISYLLTDISLLAMWKNQINKQRNENKNQ